MVSQRIKRETRCGKLGIWYLDIQLRVKNGSFESNGYQLFRAFYVVIDLFHVFGEGKISSVLVDSYVYS